MKNQCLNFDVNVANGSLFESFHKDALLKGEIYATSFWYNPSVWDKLVSGELQSFPTQSVAILDAPSGSFILLLGDKHCAIIRLLAKGLKKDTNGYLEIYFETVCILDGLVGTKFEILNGRIKTV